MKTRSRSSARTVGAGILAVAMLTALAIPAAAGPPAAGYFTMEAPFITLDPGLPAGASVKAIISSGESINGFVFEGLPDGIGVRPGADRGTVDVYVAHEQTTVPFFDERDFQDASVSKLTLSSKGGPNQGAVLNASVPLGPEEGFLRFCSASMAGPAEGLDDYVFLTGEETDDTVAGVQRGFAVVLNTRTEESTAVPGMGRLNHENTIALPGWDQVTMLTTDDTFNRPSAQVYMYQAEDQDALFADEGSLWAFRTTGKNGVAVDPADPFNGANDYGDVQPGDDLTGEFIAVPRAVALDDQTALEDWSNANNVFQFVRAEDIAYDKNDPRVVYMADTGGSQIQPNSTTGRLWRDRGASSSISPNGAIFRFEFNADDPMVVDSFSVFAQGDDSAKGAYVPFKSPDNIDTSTKSLMVQEDTRGAKIWQHRFNQDWWRVVATVNDGRGESSGIVDASDWFGEGRWLLDVQGHGVNVDEDDTTIPGTLIKRESGQLMLLNIPAS